MTVVTAKICVSRVRMPTASLERLIGLLAAANVYAVPPERPLRRPLLCSGAAVAAAAAGVAADSSPRERPDCRTVVAFDAVSASLSESSLFLGFDSFFFPSIVLALHPILQNRNNDQGHDSGYKRCYKQF